MNFSTFSKKLYGNLSGIKNQGEFVGKLFNAAGSTFFAANPLYGTYDYQRKIYNGSRAFTQPMKDSFLKPINTENLTIFFRTRIGDSSLRIIMSNFDIPSKEIQNKELLIKVLCMQFQNIVSEISNEVDDIVATNYSQLLKTRPTEIVNDAPLYSGDNFHFTSNLQTQTHVVNFYDKFEHQWIIKNTGTVTWEKRYLECTNQSAARIKALNKTLVISKLTPGESVSLTAHFDARGFEGTFESIWEMKNEAGYSCFPNKSKSLKLVVIVSNKRRTQ